MRIDHSCAPKARSSVLTVEVEGEQVLYDEHTGQLHGLNGTAAVVWSCLDGNVTLGELIDELSEAFGAAANEVRDGVYDVVRRLLDEGLLATDDEDVPGFEPLPSPADLGAPCAPCLATLDALGWVGFVRLAIGDLRTGVRATSEEGLALLERVLAPHLISDDDALVHYSLVLSEPGEDRGARALSRLYYGHRAVVRTRSRARAMRALIAHLDGHLDSTRGGRMRVGGRALVRGDEVVLLAAEHAQGVEDVEPRLRRHGIAVCDAPSVELADPGEVVLTAPTLTIDPAVLADLDAGDRADRELDQPDAGSYRLTGLVLPPGAMAEALPRPDALRAMVATVRNLRSFGTRSALDVLADQLSKVPVRTAGPGDVDQLVAEVVDLFGG